MFSLLGKESKTVLKIPGLEHQPYPLKPRMAQFDMTWSFFEDSHNLTLVIEYEPDLFLPETIARMNGHFLQIIESVIQNPDCKLSEINLLTPEERHQLLIEWNQTEVAYSQQCLHQLFEEKVRDNTEAIALIFEGKKLTYRELNNRANQVSHYLQEKGVTSEVLVGIFIERSFEMIIGILGIIKAGGAYVPFDPNYPPERLNYMNI
jgi:non-ribosomal peptide synthetase component F